MYHENPKQALSGGKSAISKIALNKRYFLISIGLKRLLLETKEDCLTRIKKEAKKRTNRKTVSTDREILIDGYCLPVNSSKSGCYTEILKSIAGQLLVCYESWKRVFVYRCDLHQLGYRGDSSEVSRLIRNLRGWVKREYKSSMAFNWVRELEKSKTQHYHLAIYIDGDKIQHPAKLGEKVRSLWVENTCGAYSMPTIGRPFHYVDDPEGLENAFYRVSYLAKARGKGYRPPQSKDYGSSRFNRGCRLL